MDRALTLVVVGDVANNAVIVIMPLDIDIDSIGPLIGNICEACGFRQVKPDQAVSGSVHLLGEHGRTTEQRDRGR